MPDPHDISDQEKLTDLLAEILAEQVLAEYDALNK